MIDKSPKLWLANAVGYVAVLGAGAAIFGGGVIVWDLVAWAGQRYLPAVFFVGGALVMIGCALGYEELRVRSKPERARVLCGFCGCYFKVELPAGSELVAMPYHKHPDRGFGCSGSYVLFPWDHANVELAP